MPTATTLVGSQEWITCCINPVEWDLEDATILSPDGGSFGVNFPPTPGKYIGRFFSKVNIF